MRQNPIPTSAFLGLMFFGINYLAGYEIGMMLTGSTGIAVLVALVMPCLSLLGVAIMMPAPTTHLPISKA